MVKRIGLIVCWLLAGWMPLRAGEYAILNGRNSCQVPFKTYNDLIVVELKINGQRPLQFIFDSGCKNTIIIKPTLIDSFSTSQFNRLYFSGLGSNDSVEVHKFSGCSLELGEIRGSNLPVFNLREDFLNFENYLGIDVDGIFGAELFEQFYIHINYKSHLIEFSRNPPKKISAHQRVPVEIRGSKGYVQSLIKTRSGSVRLIDLLLDTGANIPLIIKNQDPAMLDVERYTEAEVGEGLSGAIYAKVGRVQQLFFGTYHFDTIICAFHENAAYVKDERAGFISGNIGNELLNRFDTHFAFPDSCIYIRPLSNLSKPFDFHLINVILYEQRTDEGLFVIKSVASDSAPLLAGLQPGDVITAINRYNSRDLTLEDALSLLNKRIGKQITIKYIRDNKTYICEYIVKPII